jgi:hypothetical protein
MPHIPLSPREARARAATFVPRAWRPLVSAGLLGLSMGSALSHAQTAPTPWVDPTQLPALQAPAQTSPPFIAWPDHAITPVQEPSSDPAVLRQRWRQANASVAEFARGHMDLLHWESKNLPSRDAPQVTTDAPIQLSELVNASLMGMPALFIPPSASRAERAQGQAAYADHVSRLAQAWAHAIAARQTLDGAMASLHAQDTAVALAQRMVDAGNWSGAQLMQQQAQLIETRLSAAKAQMNALASQEQLAVLVGWWTTAQRAQLDSRLPRALPEVPALATPEPSPEAVALRADAHLQSQAQSLQASAGPQATALALRNRSVREQALAARQPVTGALTALVAPTQSRTTATDEHAQEVIEQALALNTQAIALRSQARLAWTQLSLAAYQDRLMSQSLLPLTQAQEEDVQLHYNGMLMSTWDLIEAARARLKAQARAGAARLQHWQAYIQWQAWAAGGSPTPARLVAASGADATADAPAAAH